MSAEPPHSATAVSDDVVKPHTLKQNAIAVAVMEACGFVPLSVRYKAADAALSVVQEWRDNSPIGPDTSFAP